MTLLIRRVTMCVVLVISWLYHSIDILTFGCRHDTPVTMSPAEVLKRVWVCRPTLLSALGAKDPDATNKASGASLVMMTLEYIEPSPTNIPSQSH